MISIVSMRSRQTGRRAHCSTGSKSHGTRMQVVVRSVRRMLHHLRSHHNVACNGRTTRQVTGRGVRAMGSRALGLTLTIQITEITTCSSGASTGGRRSRHEPVIGVLHTARLALENHKRSDNQRQQCQCSDDHTSGGSPTPSTRLAGVISCHSVAIRSRSSGRHSRSDRVQRTTDHGHGKRSLSQNGLCVCDSGDRDEH